MQVFAVKCPNCLDTIYSVDKNDFNSCSCPLGDGISVDGGEIDEDGVLSYLRLLISVKINRDNLEFLEINVDASLSEMYNDYINSPEGERKFGKIKGE